MAQPKITNTQINETNLDSDTLDGQSSSYYLDVSNMNAGTLPSGRLNGTYSINISGNASTATNSTQLGGVAASSYALDSDLLWETTGSVIRIIDQNDDVAIGTNGGTGDKFHIHDSSGTCVFRITNSAGGLTRQYLSSTSPYHYIFENDVTNGHFQFRTQSGGGTLTHLDVGYQSGVGFVVDVGSDTHSGSGALRVANSSDNGIAINRETSDGNLITFRRDGTLHGAISVSAGVIDYGTFSGSHWSQLTNSIRDDTILPGTVMSTIDEICNWEDETNNHLVRCKVSNVVGDTRVYGIYVRYDDNDDNDTPNTTNDLVVRSLGTSTIRVTGTCEGGDLLESNGDGTARVQSDDIIRSSTIGKVTMGSNDPNEKLVPCVLYCG